MVLFFLLEIGLDAVVDMETKAKVIYRNMRITGNGKLLAYSKMLPEEDYSFLQICVTLLYKSVLLV